MKKSLKKLTSVILTGAMVISSLSFMTFDAFAAASFTKAGGWNETLYAELTGVKDSDITAVSYSGPVSGSLTGDDFTYLVRDVSGGVRIDIPGLPKGTYTLTVTAFGQNVSKSGLEVLEYDRSGFAHYNYEEGVGAYTDEGTLKANAKVLYVTNENKDTVTVSSKDGTTVSGIGNILNSRGATGTVTNSNKGIIKKLANDGTPLVVRIIGDVKAPEGLTAYNSTDYGGSKKDNGFMARMQSGKDVTIEGIGTDATINGWGLHYICESSAPTLGTSFEVRNIAFRNVPEDCVGMEGQYTSDNPVAAVTRCWVHNCSFYAPHIANPADSDKDGGDGACDFKRGMYFTNSYCYYEGYHKTNLVGSSDKPTESLQYHLTYHHNYWKNCEARGPLARQADIHMYNNVYEGQTDYAMNPRANAYIFSEYNYMFQCKRPMWVKESNGVIKSYNDSLASCIEDMDAVVVPDKNRKVSSDNDFENFDTDPSMSYIPSGDYILQEDIADAKAVVYSQAGTMKENPVLPENVDTSVLSPDRQPTASVVLPYEQQLNDTYVQKGSSIKDNIIFNVSKTDGSSVTVGGDTTGQDIVFNVNTKVTITVTDGGGTYPVTLMDKDGKQYLTGTGSVTVPDGTYFIQSSGIQPGKGGEPAKYKEAKITALKIVAYDPNAPTVTEPTTQSTSATQATTAPQPTTQNQGGGDKPTEPTTSAPVGDNVAMGTFVFGKDASGSGVYNVTKNDTTVGNMKVSARGIESDCAKLRDENEGITFKLGIKANIEVTCSGKSLMLTNKTTGEKTEIPVGTFSKELTPGEYNITGATGSNSELSKIVLTPVKISSTVKRIGSTNDYYALDSDSTYIIHAVTNDEMGYNKLALKGRSSNLATTDTVYGDIEFSDDSSLSESGIKSDSGYFFAVLVAGTGGEAPSATFNWVNVN